MSKLADSAMRIVDRPSPPSPEMPRAHSLDLRLCGAALGAWFTALLLLRVAASQAWWVAGVAACAALGFWRWGGRRAEVPRTMSYGAAALAVGVAASALCCGVWLTLRDSNPASALAQQRSAVTAVGVVRDDPHPLASGPAGRPNYLVAATLQHLTAGSRTWQLHARVLIFADQPGWSSLLPGQRFSVRGRLAPARGGDLTSAVVNAAAAPRLIGAPPWYQRVAGSARDALRKAAIAEVPGDAGALIPALTVGDISLISPRLTDELQIVGLTHLAAVSGANLAIIVGVVLYGARAARAGPRVSALLALVAIVGFVILARPSPSVLRAAVMGGIAVVGMAAGRPKAALPMLAAAVLLLVLVDPELAQSPGFMLSVLATGALVTIAPVWRDWLRARRVPPGLAEAIAIPLAAHVVCAPVIAAMSGAVSVVAVPANLLVEPVVAPITIGGVVAVAFAPVARGLVHVSVWCVGWPARWLLEVTEVAAAFPAANIRWTPGVLGGLALAVLLCGCVLAMRRRRSRLLVATGLIMAAATLVPVRLWLPSWPPAGWQLVACDVGQGDALVLRSSAHHAVVVDTGATPALIDKCLRRYSVSSIPLLVLTHYDHDHVGGSEGVVSGRHVGAIAVNGATEPAGGVRIVRAAARHARLSPFVPEPGWSYRVGALTLELVKPAASIADGGQTPGPSAGSRVSTSSNSESLVIRARVHGISVLLTGDIGRETERELLADGAGVHCDVLKVPHHGSADADPAFFTAASPRVAIISVGAHNTYGHPTAKALQYLRRVHARVYRTDHDGDVVLSYANKRWGIATGK